MIPHLPQIKIRLKSHTVSHKRHVSIRTKTKEMGYQHIPTPWGASSCDCHGGFPECEEPVHVLVTGGDSGGFSGG